MPVTQTFQLDDSINENASVAFCFPHVGDFFLPVKGKENIRQKKGKRRLDELSFAHRRGQTIEKRFVQRPHATPQTTITRPLTAWFSVVRVRSVYHRETPRFFFFTFRKKQKTTSNDDDDDDDDHGITTSRNGRRDETGQCVFILLSCATIYTTLKKQKTKAQYRNTGVRWRK